MKPSRSPGISPATASGSKPTTGATAGPEPAPKLRRLLPASRPPTRTGSGVEVPRRRRTYTTAACEACRKRKARCNAERPSCAYCVSTDILCVYDTSASHETHSQALKRKFGELEARAAIYVELYELLRDRPDIESAEIFKRIRGGGTPGSILRRIKEGDLLLQLSLKPETRYRYVFPYVKQMPTHLYRADNPYIESCVYDWSSSPHKNPGISNLAKKSIPDSPRTSSSPEPGPPSIYLMPFHTAEVIDPLLNDIYPSKWTVVCNDDALMRKLIGSWLLNEYQWIVVLQKDCFLQDMAAMRRGCCSSLLVNAVLANASMAYPSFHHRYQYWSPHNLAYQFMAEAKRLWELESDTPRLTTIQAAMLMNVNTNMNAMDEIGFNFTKRGVEMANQIGLLTPSRDLSLLKGPENALQGRKALSRSFTAWALFNFQALHAYVLFEPPLIKKPPDVSLPDPADNPEWYGQVWLKYPGDTKLHTTNFPYQFQAQCQVRVIMNDMWLERFGSSRQSSPEGGHILLPSTQLEQANRFYARLKAWYDALPAPLTPSNIVFPSQILLHTNYQNILANLYESITITASNASMITTIKQAASCNFETLLRLYYLRHGFGYGDQFLVQPLNTLGFWSLSKVHSAATENDDIDGSTNNNLRATQATLLLAAKGLHEQSSSFYLDRVTLQLLRSKMRPEERQLLENEVLFYDRDYRDGGPDDPLPENSVRPRNQLDKKIKSKEPNQKKENHPGAQTGLISGTCDDKEQGETGKELIREVRSKWVVSVRSVDDDPEIHRLQKLVRDNLKLDDTGEYSDEDERVYY
ncbi:hypothetical protein B0T21DRAFT_401867 [Apiosordaria backusii]|uniref:Zn(2)-C6 fungal-type domain-containing protein n=1 Tax=Apiosordaria backusii TaxID=314023 RepID=A0AA40BLG8_9PEZI|nr:hypothetical protein B0T21DRAFT_401867 [Apiosordaria backusii]